jgi:hypothetical protein
MRSDTKRRKKTNKRTAKDKALTELVGGATITEAALSAGVQRQTVSGWFNRDDDFRASYAASVNKVRRTVEQRIGAGAGRAVEVLLELFDDEDSRIRLTAAVKILELHRRQPGPTDAPDSEVQSMTIKELVASCQDKIENGLGGGL